jgi:hypothetical protein
MMKTFFLSLFCFAVIGFTSDAQITLNGVTLPAKINQDKTELVLNGGGIRKKAFFKVYVAGLYLPAKSKNGNEIATADKPVAIRLQITSSVVSSSNMSESIREGFALSTGGKTAPIQSKIDAFINVFSKEEIKEGNVFDIWYVPGEGVKAYKNGKYQSTIEGLDFKKALFGIWLSDNPVDADLKKGLLGG